MLEIIKELKKETTEGKLDLELMLIDSLVYDWEFPTSVEKQPEKRKEYIEKNNFLEIFLDEIEKIEELFRKENLSPYWTEIASKNLESFIFISLLTWIHWNNIYWISAKNINIKINPDGEILKAISKLFHEIITKKPFLRFNFSRWLLLVNILLKKIWYPPLYISSNDKKRVYKTIDYYIDFEKEFMITLLSRINKNIYENKYPKKIISAKEKRTKENKKSVYLKPGYWWWWEDRLIYTINK